MKTRRQRQIEELNRYQQINLAKNQQDSAEQSQINLRSSKKCLSTDSNHSTDDESSPSMLSDSQEKYNITIKTQQTPKPKENLRKRRAVLRSDPKLCSRMKPIKLLDKSKRKEFIQKSSKVVQESLAANMMKSENHQLRVGFSQMMKGPNDIIDTWSDLSSTMIDTLMFEKSEIEGWGVRSTCSIDKNQIVAEYVGEIIRPVIADKRQVYNEKHGNHGTYIFKLDSQNYLDATQRGGIARFINHSCDPNCRSELVTMSNGRKAVVIISNQYIPPNTEITYDYKLPYESPDKAIKCLCGSDKCRHYLNWGDNLASEVLPLKNIPEKILITLLDKDILPASIFKTEAELMRNPK